MTEHNSKELEKQYHAAVSRRVKANEDERESLNRYTRKLFQESGLEGCVAEYTVDWGRKRGATINFLAMGIIHKYSSPYLWGYVLKKDGSVGAREFSCLLSEAFNKGKLDQA